MNLSIRAYTFCKSLLNFSYSGGRTLSKLISILSYKKEIDLNMLSAFYIIG